MRLFDAAEVISRADGGWDRGWDADSRICGDISVYLSECDPEVTADVIGTQTEDGDPLADCGYRVIPFGIVATLRRSTRAAQDDDEAWLVDALRESAEIPVARSLMVQQGMGLVQTVAAGGDPVVTDVWLGNPAVEGVAAPTMTDEVAVAAAVADARARFFRKTIGVRPILHVSPEAVIPFTNAGVLMLDPASGEIRTAWQDTVAISEGYSDIPGMTASPVAFFTGPIVITLSEPKPEDVVRSVRRNLAMYQVTMLAAVDTPPCAIVRIGDAPAPVVP